jgi:hypothetical protein
MEKIAPEQPVPLCPSAQPNMENSVAFGMITGSVNSPRLSYLSKPRPVTREMLAFAAPAKPTEVFRFAATCEEKKCQHFDGVNCGLAQRIVELMPAVEENLPPCRIRSSCRWWQQEGKAACMRCPQVTTMNYNPSELLQQVGTPNSHEIPELDRMAIS